MVRMLQCEVPGIVKILVSNFLLFFLLFFTGMMFLTWNRFGNYNNSSLVIFSLMVTKLSNILLH